MNRNLILIGIIAVLIVLMIRYGSTGNQGKLLFDEPENPYSLNEEQARWLDSVEQIVIGVADDTAPLLTWTEAGQAEGLLVDYLDGIATAYELPVVYREVALKDVRQNLAEGTVDAVIYVYDGALGRGLKPTMPMMKNKGILFVDKELDLKKLSRGAGLRIEVVEGSPGAFSLQKQLPEAELLFSPTMAEAVRNLMDGRGNAIRTEKHTSELQ